MGLFAGKKRRRYIKTPKTPNQVLSQAYSKLLAKKPDLAEKIALKEAGHLDLLPAPEDATEAKKRQLKDRIVDRVWERVQKNPDLLDSYQEQVMLQVLGEPAHGKSEDYGDGFAGYTGQSIDDLLDNLERLEQVKERLIGGKETGPLGGLINAEVIAQVLKLLTGHLAQPPDGVAVVKYVVDAGNGKLLELDAGGYKRYLESRRQIAPPLPQQSSSTAETKTVESSQQSLGIESWLVYLDGDPSDFVAALRAQANEGDEQAKFTLDFLANVDDVEAVLAVLRPFKSKEEYKDAIERLEEQKEWLEKVIKLVKERKQSGN